MQDFVHQPYHYIQTQPLQHMKAVQVPTHNSCNNQQEAERESNQQPEVMEILLQLCGPPK